MSGTTNVSISVALKTAGAGLVGETVSDVTETIKELTKEIEWDSILVKFEEEKRQFGFID